MVGKYKTILVTTEDKITKIMLNRPDKKNAINLVMYEEIMHALDEAAKDDSTLTVITGCGSYFSSGNDLKDFSENVDEIMKDDGKLLVQFIHHFVDFPKPLVALVNGPAIGLAATLLGLCDIVYAMERATIHAPFVQLGLSPEGCSSYTFPKIMGPAQANEMLLFNKKIMADEACTKGLVTEVFADSTFQGEVWTRLKAYANLPKNSLATSKQLMRSMDKEILHAVSLQESKLIAKKIFSDECNNGLQSFFQKGSKL
ncbi:PREDICTED: enoyl-CoA delta isomerase 2, mitochondrial-like [Gekko japonicus]|uniref:Enoyl-CoA delta isomerase 2, mitochondrial-like n=1 Tax=Gekko japonicus TaxID=146911 RepID=A0ABM1KSS2_GEKJA|nr:PREDICTED: enoyl-CoA delta isomerase 2, mitochondrial-like [Gekko japonicus]